MRELRQTFELITGVSKKIWEARLDNLSGRANNISDDLMQIVADMRTTLDAALNARVPAAVPMTVSVDEHLKMAEHADNLRIQIEEIRKGLEPLQECWRRQGYMASKCADELQSLLDKGKETR